MAHREGAISGWVIMSRASVFNHNTMLLTQTSQRDNEILCRLDILGKVDTAEHDQILVHAEFKEQLQGSPEGWYKTGLKCRGSHPVPQTNMQGSLSRISSPVKKLERNRLTDEYMTVLLGNSWIPTLSKSHRRNSKGNNSIPLIRLCYEKSPKQQRPALCTMPQRMQLRSLHGQTNASLLVSCYRVSFGSYWSDKGHIPC